MTPEEIEAYYESIPEWKRGALVVGDKAEDEAEELGRFGRFKGKLQEKIDSTEAA